MAVTHADLTPRHRGSAFGSKIGVIFMIFSIFFGLTCFILSLIAEATRSQVTWVSSADTENGERYECSYSNSGKMPLLCAAAAFVALAIAMVVEHSYMLAVVSKSTPMSLLALDPYSDSARSLSWQAGFFFVTTWICFAVGEILLLIGVSVESGNLKNWSIPRTSCLMVRQGLFCAAGVFGLSTVIFASGLYITVLRTQQQLQDEENRRREILQISVLHAFSARSPRHGQTTTVRTEIPEDQTK